MSRNPILARLQLLLRSSSTYAPVMMHGLLALSTVPARYRSPAATSYRTSSLHSEKDSTAQRHGTAWRAMGSAVMAAAHAGRQQQALRNAHSPNACSRRPHLLNPSAPNRCSGLAASTRSPKLMSSRTRGSLVPRNLPSGRMDGCGVAQTDNRA